MRDKAHRKFIASLPCCVTGLQDSSQCAHISKERFSAGLKASDVMCVPMSVDEHRTQTLWPHGEVDYWSYHGGIKKAKKLAMDLYRITGQTDLAIELIEEFRNDNR